MLNFSERSTLSTDAQLKTFPANLQSNDEIKNLIFHKQNKFSFNHFLVENK